MQKKGCHIWFRPGEKWIPNGLTRNTQFSIQIRYYDETSPTNDREIEKDQNPANLMEKYFDFNILNIKAKNILRTTIDKNFSSSTYDELPGHVRVIFSVKQKEGKNKRYSLNDLITTRVAFDARDIIDMDESKWDVAPQPIYLIVKKDKKKADQSKDKGGKSASSDCGLRQKVASNKPFNAIFVQLKDLFTNQL